MSRTLNVQFVSAPVCIIRAIDLEAALVYGLIWSKENIDMGYGYCFASLPTMAKELNISECTVRRRIAKLLSFGFIEDITPNKSFHAGETRHYKTVMGFLEDFDAEYKEYEKAKKERVVSQ